MLDPAAVESDLVSSAVAGDGEASNELVRRHRAAAFRFALQLTGNREDALDVTQEALVRFVDTLDRFDPERPVQPWLFRIVRNKAYDLARRQRVRRAESLDELLEKGMPVPAQREPHPIEALELADLRRRLWTALRRLPEAQREILVLREYEDLSYGEIAQVLSVPTGTVMSRLHRARKALRELLLEEDRDRGTQDE